MNLGRGEGCDDGDLNIWPKSCIAVGLIQSDEDEGRVRKFTKAGVLMGDPCAITLATGKGLYSGTKALPICWE